MHSASRRSAWRASTPIRAESVVIVFARAPLAGRVKTRLIPRLGAAGAARLQERLVCAALRTASGWRVELHVTKRHAFFRSLHVHCRMQRGHDLGSRMHHALRGALRRYRSAMLIGADCPGLTPADLRRAVRMLQAGADIVLAPAEDGGYALIAARRISPEVFAKVEWGGADVLAHTLANLKDSRLSHRLLRTVWDVDRPEDLERLRSPRFSSAARRGARR
jgi:rSAM/selenodomain-associated transferase 1